MPDLIATLHVQHLEIRRLATQVSDASASGDVATLRSGLDALGTALLAHLAIEDAQLYPALTEAAERTKLEMPAKIARTYAMNMETISVALRAFLDRYSRGLDLVDFRRDWVLVAQLLTDRIESEEATLYPLYRSWIKHT